MELMQLMQDRYSVRSFSDRPVEAEKIEAILRAGRLAPTACNYQPQRVLVLNDAESLARWKKCTHCHFNEQLVFIVCYDESESWKRKFDGQDSGYVDGSIVGTHMMLEAAELGIGSTWVMYFIPEAVKEEFSLPEGIVPVCALPMGYATDDAKPSPMHAERKELSETVVYGSFAK